MKDIILTASSCNKYCLYAVAESGKYRQKIDSLLEAGKVSQIARYQKILSKKQEVNVGSAAPMETFQRIKKRAWACQHSEKQHYGKGMCSNCYHLAYYYQRRRLAQDKQSPSQPKEYLGSAELDQ